jgi:hypothetical protein
MLDQIKNEVIRTVMTVRIQTREEVEAAEAAMQAAAAHLENVNYQHADFDPTAAPEELMAPQAVTAGTTAMSGRPVHYLHGHEGRPQRPVPLRQRQEVQGLPRQAGLIPGRSKRKGSPRGAFFYSRCALTSSANPCATTLSPHR